MDKATCDNSLDSSDVDSQAASLSSSSTTVTPIRTNVSISKSPLLPKRVEEPDQNIVDEGLLFLIPRPVKDTPQYVEMTSGPTCTSNKKTRGLHAPPKHLSQQQINDRSSEYLWEATDRISRGSRALYGNEQLQSSMSPPSPPESTNRSIGFDQLRHDSLNKSSWPFRFMNQEEGLLFNNHRKAPRSPPPILFAESASPDIYFRGERSVGRQKDASIKRNIAPLGLGEFDYNLSAENYTHKRGSPSHGTKNLYSFGYLAQLPVFRYLSQMGSTTLTNQGRKILMFFVLLAALIGSTIIVANDGPLRKRTGSPSSVTSVPVDAKLNDTSGNPSRRDRIVDFIDGANITDKNILVGKVTHYNSPQVAALDWILNKDRWQLNLSDDSARIDLIARYACAVFYFSVEDWTKEGKDPTIEQDEVNDYNKMWLSESHVCEWTGILCAQKEGGYIDGTAYEVTQFQFIDGKVNGPLVRELLVAFQNLQVLDFRGGGLKGALPVELTSLAKLKVLSLDDNTLTGSLPSEIGRLTSLQLLGLHNNQLESQIPNELWNLTQLRALYLDGNHLKGSLPSEVSRLENIVDLRVSNNYFDGKLPDALGALTELRVLYVDANYFSGPLPNKLGDLHNLESLFISGNAFDYQVPSEFGNLINLVHFIADNNKLSGNFPEQLLQLPSLEKLWLRGNDFSGTVTSESCENKEPMLEIKQDCRVVCTCCDGCFE